MNAFIRLLYAVLIAISVVVFVGVGINSVYPGPKAPEYPEASYSVKDPSSDPAFQERQKAYDESYKEFRQKEKNYQRNISGIAIVLSVLIVAGGLWYMRKSEIIGEGLALGGVAVSIFSVIVASMAEHRIVRLIAVTAFLVSALLLVRRRFLDEAPQPKKKRS